jgi:hypothetical protein
LKVQGTRATITVSFPLRCKDELHCIRRCTRTTKASHNFGNIIKGENGSVINLDNISTLETLLEGFEGPMLHTGTTMKDLRDKSQMRALVKLEAKGTIVGEVKRHCDTMHTNKGVRRHIKGGQGHIDLHHIWALGLNTIEEMDIGRLLVKVIHPLIKMNMLSFLYILTFNIIVNKLLHTLGEAKEGADA